MNTNFDKSKGLGNLPMSCHFELSLMQVFCKKKSRYAKKKKYSVGLSFVKYLKRLGRVRYLKKLCFYAHDQCFHCTVIWLYNKKKISWAVVKRISRSSLIKYYGMYILKRKANTRSTNTDHKHFLMPQLILYAP